MVDAGVEREVGRERLGTKREDREKGGGGKKERSHEINGIKRSVHRSMPRDATLPANLAPALPLFCSFSRSLLSKELGPCDDGTVSFPPPRRLGRVPRVSPLDFPDADCIGGAPKAGTRAVRWLRYS